MDEVKGGRARKTWVEGVGGSGAYLRQEKGRKGEREQEMSCQRERATKSAEQRSSQLASVSSKKCAGLMRNRGGSWSEVLHVNQESSLF